MYSSTNRRRRFLDLIIYLMVSVAVGGSVVVAAIEGVPKARIMNWYGFALFTACVFGQFVRVSRQFWRKGAFWIVCAASLASHLLCCVWLIHLEGEISGKQWLLLALVEVFILVNLRSFLFGPKPSSPK
jgi:hypothetical protein